MIGERSKELGVGGGRKGRQMVGIVAMIMCIACTEYPPTLRPALLTMDGTTAKASPDTR